MVPNTKALMALGLAFIAGVSPAPPPIADRSVDPSARGSGSAVETGRASSAWQDPATAKPVAAAPAQAMPRNDRRRADAADPDRPPLPPARPPDGLLRAPRPIPPVRQAHPWEVAIQEGLPDLVQPPPRRRTPAATDSVDGSAFHRVRPVGGAPVPRPVHRLAGDLQGHGATRPVQGSDGLLRWLAE